MSTVNIREGRTVNKEMYTEIFRRVRDAERKKHPGKWVQSKFFLLHNIAPARRSVVIRNYLV
jgi:hypothetical protein